MGARTQEGCRGLPQREAMMGRLRQMDVEMEAGKEAQKGRTALGGQRVIEKQTDRGLDLERGRKIIVDK